MLKNPFFGRKERYEYAKSKCEAEYFETVRKEILKYKGVGLSRYGFDVAKIEVKFNLVHKRVAAYAYYKRMLITINPVYFLSNLEDMIEQTVPHEVSHIIAGNSYGFDIKSHGKEWKEVIVSLGKEPIICHNYDKKLA